MSDRAQTIQRAILATATAFVMSHHGSPARAMCRDRMHELMGLQSQLGTKPDLAADSDLGHVVTAVARMAGGRMPPDLVDPEFYLRTALQRYFAGQSQKLATDLRLVEAVQ